MEVKAQELLEVFIITYNRSVHLDNTLRQLVGCPFTQFLITILDNCSEDNTHNVFLNYQHRFPNLKYIKNKINIGADANVLRAAELSDGLYTWILCDDDNYDFSVCDDVLAELNRGQASAIMVGWSDEFIWPTGGMYDTPAKLMEKNFPYFSVTTFVPSAIFKTVSFQEQIRISYTNVGNLLPVLTYYIRLDNENKLIYVSKKKLVAAMGLGGYHYSYIRVMVAVINTFSLIKPLSIRRKSFYTIYLPQSYYSLFKHAILWYEARKQFSISDKWHYFNLLNLKDRLVFLVLITIAPLIKGVHIPTTSVKRIKALFTKKPLLR